MSAIGGPTLNQEVNININGVSGDPSAVANAVAEKQNGVNSRAMQSMTGPK
ncbi:hypothetical protein OS11_39410 [Dickeya oryzae]